MQYYCKGREGAQNPLEVEINDIQRKVSAQQYQIDSIASLNRFGIGTNFDSAFNSGEDSGSQWQMSGYVWECLMFKTLTQSVETIKQKQQDSIGFTLNQQY